MQRIVLRNIADCDEEQQQQLRLIRNQPSVRTSMYTDHEIGVDEHRSWLQRLRNDPKQIVFIVLIEDKVAGAVSISDLDRRHRKSDWAFYLDENQRGGLGAALEFALINFAFDDLQLEKLNCEVIETNPAVVRMHKRFGFEEEGFRRSNIEKDGERIGVHFLGLVKADWLASRDAVEAGCRSVLDRFTVRIEA